MGERTTASQPVSAGTMSETVVRRAAVEYPWFAWASLMLDERPVQVRLALLARPVPSSVLRSLDGEDWSAYGTGMAGEAEVAGNGLREVASGAEDRLSASDDGAAVSDGGTIGIIDAFLSRGEHRIVPQESTPECGLAERSAILEEDSEFLSEDLARIYREQGLTDMAKEIYRGLGLLYPEKSVYFAEIIAEIDRQDTNINH
ncbi:MAG: hypothetical protein IJC16_10630 [Rikenellaceae bacterium]|nr:hypothetical protein [Rikenellaceae bacterium]